MSDETEFDINHDGQSFIVIVSYETRTVDDTFTGHLGGCLHDFKQSHEEIDPESVDIVSCKNEDEVEIDPEDVPGLMGCIEYKLEELDLNQ